MVMALVVRLEKLGVSGRRIGVGGLRRAADWHAGRQRAGTEIRFAMMQLVRPCTCVDAESGGRSFLEGTGEGEEQVTGGIEGGIDCLAGGWAIAGTAAKRTTNSHRPTNSDAKRNRKRARNQAETR